MQLPIGEESGFAGVIDLMEMKAIYWEDQEGREPIIREIPESMRESAEFAREQMVEKAAEIDDELIERFLEGETISNEDLKNQSSQLSSYQ